MEPKLLRFTWLIFEGVTENYSEVKSELESRGIFPDKLTETVLNKIEQMRVERKIEQNKTILSAFKENLTSEEDLSSETEYRIAANFRKKDEITENDIESVNHDKAKLKSLEQLADKINEQSGENSSKKNS